MFLRDEFWQKKLKALSRISQSKPEYDDFLDEMLEMIVRSSGAISASFMHCEKCQNENDYLVTGRRYPTQPPFNAKFASGDTLSLASTSVIMENAAQRFVGEIKKFDDGEVYISAWQLAFDEINIQNVLVLTFTSEYNNKKEINQDKLMPFDFLSDLCHHANAKYLLRHKRLDELRHDAAKNILSIQGTMPQTAHSITDIWKDFIGAKAARMWLYNWDHDELNLISQSIDESDNSIFQDMNNTIPIDSLAGKAIEKNEAIWETSPLDNPSWSGEPNQEALYSKYPQLLCIPFILKSKKTILGKEEHRWGCIDLHFDAESLRPDHSFDMLLLLGSISATILLQAHCAQARMIVDKMNTAARDIITPQGLPPLRERKNKVLRAVSDLIRKALHCNCVSIFESESAIDTIRCVFTTGLEEVPPKALKDIVYRDGDKNITWKIYKKVKYKNVRLVSRGKHCEKRTRTILDPDNDPFLGVPLIGKDNSHATGVIRVLERECFCKKGHFQVFNQYNLDLLTTIAEEASPLLEMLRIQEFKTRFAKRAMHNLIQPLTGLQAYISNILSGVYSGVDRVDPGSQAGIKLAIRQGNGSICRKDRTRIEMASGVTDFSHLSGFKYEWFPTTRYFLERIMDLQPLRYEENIRIELHDPETIDTFGNFRSDELYFDQAFHNILHNSVKYAFPNTTTVVVVKKQNRDLVVDVKSTGVPIEPGEKDNLFYDSTRGYWAARYDPTGTGQGLYITRMIMKGLGGSLKLVSNRANYRIKSPAKYPFAQDVIFRITLPEAFK